MSKVVKLVRKTDDYQAFFFEGSRGQAKTIFDWISPIRSISIEWLSLPEEFGGPDKGRLRITGLGIYSLISPGSWIVLDSAGLIFSGSDESLKENFDIL